MPSRHHIDSQAMQTHHAILTYHSQNIGGPEAHVNDHVALRDDLLQLTENGYQIVSLSRMLDLLESGELADKREPLLALTFDDGCDFDVRDIDYPGAGLQRSFLGIMQDFQARFGGKAQPGLHATTFVIASQEARAVIDATSLFGKGWMSDSWWADAAASDLLDIGNHGWDHNHVDIEPGDKSRGGFTRIDTDIDCRLQVEQAAAAIKATAGVWPNVFAYPFGESSTYIRERYFPGRQEQHGCRAALGTDPGYISLDSDRWNLPRYVCGRDWRSSGQLIDLISQQTAR